MDRRISVSVQSLVLTLFVLLALAAAYAIGSTTTTAQAADEEQAGPARTLVMRGVGRTTAVPDQLTFTVAVEVTRDDVAPAMDQANRTLRRVLAALADHGVRKADTRSTGFSIEPQYRYPDDGEPVLTGYRVDSRVGVTVRDLREAGRAIGSAVRAGGNAVRVSDIALGLQDPDGVLAEARDAAVGQATEKAEQYAEATGQELGDVHSLREVTLREPRPEPWELSYAARDLSRVAKAVPIRAGQEELSVTVQVAWTLG